jgi:hypothetical protein
MKVYFGSRGKMIMVIDRKGGGARLGLGWRSMEWWIGTVEAVRTMRRIRRSPRYAAVSHREEYVF